MRSLNEYREVKRLIDSHWRDCDIARHTGIPARTVSGWRRGTRRVGRKQKEKEVFAVGGWRPDDPVSYSYLLGLYLGDGHIAAPSSGNSYIRLFLDAAYGDVVDEAAVAVAAVANAARVTRQRRPRERLTIVQCCWPGWPTAFPQHGSGRKHERRIILAPWQKEIAELYPRELVRGLIHSDGCRCRNRFRTRLPSGRVAEYEYVRYFFSNRSEDILSIFTTACAALGVHWTRSNHRNISISKRESVVFLDSFVGPKR